MAPSSTEIEALDDALLLRVGSFEEQLAGWRRAKRVGLPLLTLDDAPRPGYGRCVSCGEAAASWRCSLCLEAAQVVLELADTEGERLVPRTPIINPVLVAIEDAARERDLWRAEA
jgi:hypothetical protein